MARRGIPRQLPSSRELLAFALDWAVKLFVPVVEHSTVPLQLSSILLQAETTAALSDSLQSDLPAQHLLSISLAHWSQLLELHPESNVPKLLRIFLNRTWS